MVACIVPQFFPAFRAPADRGRRIRRAAPLFLPMCVAAPTLAAPRRKLLLSDRSVSLRFCWQSTGSIKARRKSGSHSKRETMKTSFSTKQLALAAACAIALSFVSGAAQAQVSPSARDGERDLWQESSRTTIWRNPFGLCWQSAFGPPPGAECNPAPVAQYVAPAPAPAPYVAPPPAPVQYVAPAPAPAPYVAPAPLPVKKDRN
jgi:hypothetical protein